MAEKRAWVSLATNDSYALGALVLANSLKLSNTIHDLAILVTPGVSQAMTEQLSTVYNLVQTVDVLDSKDAANLALLARPELGVTFTKLHCWALTQYTKCVFLDADTLVLQNCDELFDREELSAAPDAGWPDCFNSGVFVFKPSNETFKAVIDYALANGSFDGGDQGLLNSYFSDWATKDIQKHLPFTYNMVCSATYSYLPAFKFFGNKVKIVHFIGANKPWLQSEPTSTTLSNYVELWWNIFNGSVSKKLNNQMINNCTVFGDGTKASHDCTPPLSPVLNQIRHKFVDPWETIDQPDSPCRSDEDDTLENSNIINVSFQQDKPTEISITQRSPSEFIDLKNNYVSNVVQTKNELVDTDKKINLISNTKEQFLAVNKNFQNPILTDVFHKQIDKPSSNFQTKINSEQQIKDRYEPYNNSSYNNFSHPCNECSVLKVVGEAKHLDCSGKTGLAGALGGGLRADVEEQWRKHNWEQGVIDFTGKDSFENIWKKISETVGLSSPIPADGAVVASGPLPVSDAKPPTVPTEAVAPVLEVKNGIPTEVLPAPQNQEAVGVVAQTVPQDSVKPEVLPADQPKPDIPKTEAQVSDQSKPEASKTEAQPPVQLKPETPGTEAQPADQLKTEISKTEAQSQDQSKSETPKANIPEGQIVEPQSTETLGKEPQKPDSQAPVPLAPVPEKQPTTPESTQPIVLEQPPVSAIPTQQEVVTSEPILSKDAPSAPIVDTSKPEVKPSDEKSKEVAPAEASKDNKEGKSEQKAEGPVPLAADAPQPLESPKLEEALKTELPAESKDATKIEDTLKSDCKTGTGLEPSDQSKPLLPPQEAKAPAPAVPSPANDAPSSEIPKNTAQLETQKPTEPSQKDSKPTDQQKIDAKPLEPPKDDKTPAVLPSDLKLPEPQKEAGAEKAAEQKPTAAAVTPTKQGAPDTPTVTSPTPGTPGTPVSPSFPEEAKLQASPPGPQTPPAATTAAAPDVPVPPKRKGNQKGSQNGKQGKGKK